MFKTLGTAIVMTGLTLASMQSLAENQFPYCQSANSDSDNDGYGWENDQTCLVAPGNVNNYTVTIRNLTYHQVFSPIMAVTHDDSIALLQAGKAAGAGITAIAEGGDTSVLAGELSGVVSVGGVGVSCIDVGQYE